MTLTIPPSGITALVGPNGAGKSTLIRACVGFERPDEGRVFVFGIDPQRRRAAAVGRIGYVPQSTALYRGLTIRDHLVMGISARADFDAAYAQSRIVDAGLEAERTLGELSGGEQAQVALALALARSLHYSSLTNRSPASTPRPARLPHGLGRSCSDSPNNHRSDILTSLRTLSMPATAW